MMIGVPLCCRERQHRHSSTVITGELNANHQLLLKGGMFSLNPNQHPKQPTVRLSVCCSAAASAAETLSTDGACERRGQVRL
jgi:hypothetical protein